MENLATGSIVKLKSGGPLMTVRTVSDQAVTCDWFVGGQDHSGTFDKAQLEVPAHQ